MNVEDPQCNSKVSWLYMVLHASAMVMLLSVVHPLFLPSVVPVHADMISIQDTTLYATSISWQVLNLVSFPNNFEIYIFHNSTSSLTPPFQ